MKYTVSAIILTLMFLLLYVIVWTELSVSLYKKLLCTGGLLIVEVFITKLLLIMDDNNDNKKEINN